MRGAMRQQYIRTERLEGASLRAVMAVSEFREEKASSDARLLEGRPTLDGFVYAGRSRAGTSVGATL